MNVNAVRCPNCGGDVDLDAKMCPYCHSDIICSDYEAHKKIIADILMAARGDIASGRYSECRSHVDDVLTIDPDCADAWYISAALCSSDDVRFEAEKKRASECRNRYGVFGESYLDVYRKKALQTKKKKVTMIFLIIGFYVFFIGGSLSLGLGLAFGTLIPLYVTLGLMAILLAIYLLATKRFRDKD